jgi:N-methylhydantoinase A/oxoprolinase/acetone carboxylase beta subunit
MVSHQVYDMDKLRPNTKISGPAIIEEESSTFIVARGGRVTVDGRGWIVVELQEPSLETAT